MEKFQPLHKISTEDFKKLKEINLQEIAKIKENEHFDSLPKSQ